MNLKGNILAVSFFLLTYMISAVTCAFAAEPSGAESLQSAGGMPIVSKRAINVTQIENFAKLQISLDKINDQYEDRISENVEGDHSELYAEASEKMLEAIKEHDFSIAEYHRIAGAVIVDDATHQRVIAKIKELRGTPQ